MKSIGLDVILISSQTNSLDNTSSSRSLNTHCSNPKDYITCGYISAFEFQKPHIEGILINNLKEIDIDDFAKIISSDCHEWEAYPWHDKKTEGFLNNEKKHFTKIKCLPTFKGLMMAFTSPRTRFNRIENNNIVVENIEIGNNIIPLSRGINVIIGDNGSGKSSILEALTLTQSDIPNHYKKFNKEYNIKVSRIEKVSFRYIPQSYIFDRRKKGELFSDLIWEGIGEIIIDHKEFDDKFNDYFEKIVSYIEYQILINDKKMKLNNKLELTTENLINPYYINVLNTDSIKLETNIHDKRNNKLKNILSDLMKEIDENNDYYDKFKLTESLKKIKDEILKIQEIVKVKYDLFEKQNNIKNILIKKVNDYNLEIKNKSTALDNQINEYVRKKQEIIDSIINFIKLLNKKILFPNFPSLINGKVVKKKEGYKFIKKAKYDNEDIKSEFYENIFNKKWKENELKDIKTKNEFIESIKGATSNSENYKKIMQQNLQKFFDKMKKEEDFIMEASYNKDIGNTPGELSLAYYKFIIQKNNSWEILLLDQPEENISNKKIYNDFIKHISGLKDNKQIIIVTHNPLLIINLDVDNVVHIKKNKKEIVVSNGCLEYEDNDYNILSLIASDIDGGYEAIEKRMKIYDKRS